MDSFGDGFVGIFRYKSEIIVQDEWITIGVIFFSLNFGNSWDFSRRDSLIFFDKGLIIKLNWLFDCIISLFYFFGCDVRVWLRNVRRYSYCFWGLLLFGVYLMGIWVFNYGFWWFGLFESSKSAIIVEVSIIFVNGHNFGLFGIGVLFTVGRFDKMWLWLVLVLLSGYRTLVLLKYILSTDGSRMLWGILFVDRVNLRNRLRLKWFWDVFSRLFTEYVLYGTSVERVVIKSSVNFLSGFSR